MYFWHLFETYCRSGKQNSRYRTCPTRYTVHVCVCMCLFWAVTQCPRDTAISISLIKYKSSVIELIYLSLFLLLLPLHSYKFSMPIRMVVCSSRKWPSKLSRKKKMKPASAWLPYCNECQQYAQLIYYRLLPVKENFLCRQVFKVSAKHYESTFKEITIRERY